MNKNYLIYDKDSNRSLLSDFDIATPQEVADTFNKTVLAENKMYTPKEK